MFHLAWNISYCYVFPQVLFSNMCYFPLSSSSSITSIYKKTSKIISRHGYQKSLNLLKFGCIQNLPLFTDIETQRDWSINNTRVWYHSARGPLWSGGQPSGDCSQTGHRVDGLTSSALREPCTSGMSFNLAIQALGPPTSCKELAPFQLLTHLRASRLTTSSDCLCYPALTFTKLFLILRIQAEGGCWGLPRTCPREKVEELPSSRLVRPEGPGTCHSRLRTGPRGLWRWLMLRGMGPRPPKIQLKVLLREPVIWTVSTTSNGK